MLSELMLFLDAIYISDLYLKLSLGFIFGLCLGLTGVGGGVLLIPILQSVLGMHTVLAVGTASIIASLVKATAAATHVQQQNVDWKQVGLMFLGALPMTLFSAQVIVQLNANPLYRSMLNQVIQGIIILVMVASLILVCKKYRRQKPCCTGKHITLNPKHRVSFLSGMFCGSLLGTTGVGGGIILLPLLNSVIGINIKRAIGSSVVLSLLLSAVTAWSYTKNGQGDLTTAFVLVVGSFAAIPMTGHLLKRLNEQQIYQLTISVIFLSLIITLTSEVL
ncbi:hypothetical protein M445_18285 [Vibrio owensii 47666-1]|uniref:sulfite exporter TauE/SafE family protein n=1 Tax=Vibrio owensii TaxID=696485 RepID=UPI00058567E7|nr:sulfite exporter TauE/SafE family protein [Vibrio owensii]KIF46285.1 hypothetical protein M445_18285 [Vibrio owensii 47666-1]